MTKRKSTKDRLDLDKVDFYTYEAFCIAELLSKKDGISVKGMTKVDEFTFQPDLYSE